MEFVKWNKKHNGVFYFECDRVKNNICERAKKNLPCNDCVGTRYMKFAKVYDNDIIKDNVSFHCP